MTAVTSQKGEVIFQPRAQALNTKVSRQIYERRKLTDCGNHVEWTDGKKVWKWRLPDQTNGPAEYPVLKSILFVPMHPALPVADKTVRVAFIADDGHLLTHLSTRSPILPQKLLDIILPVEAFARLEKRGVQRVIQPYHTVADFYRAHPDPTMSKFSLSFALHPGRWVWGTLISIVIIVNAILLLTGYYD